ncbi:MAG: hypothetical protein RBU21_24780, partial [FCB group bacterium]|nr:hypothetical protein [FCB group bacterium]
MDRLGIPESDFPELKKILGNRLSVKGYYSDTDDGRIIRQHLCALNELPKGLLQKVVDQGLRAVLIGPGSIPQLPGYAHLVNVRVPNRKDGMTFLDLSGCYDGKNLALLLGTADPEPHVVEHEFSHALIDVMGYLDDFRVVKCYRDRASRLNEFYVPNGIPSRTGMDEFLADILAGVIIFGERFIKGYERSFV